ncbi:MAG TPA: AMP-binding protein, partial [Stellaceae bacterium]|nr:AMP-binding protein [Stellaceae bacterium]
MTELSYVHGASDKPLIGETIGAHFDRVAARFGERDALIVRHQNIRWTYRRLKEEAEAFAAGLLSLGLEPGMRVGIWSPNNAEWVVAQFATAKAGLILVNINPAYRTAELEYALNKAGCAALITATRFKSSDYLAMLRALAPELAVAAPGELRAARLPELRLVITIGAEDAPGTMRFAEICGRGGRAERDRLMALADRLQFDDPINIQFTSGTTGFPKGATLTHHNILNNGFFIGEAMKLGAADRLCIPVPLYHCFGMVLGNLACMTHGAAMVFPSEAFDPLATLEAVEAERCTALHGVPTMFIAEMDHPDFDKFDLSSLRTGIMAGSPCPIEVMKRAVGRMHLSEITIAYGMTETSPVSFQSATDDPLERRVATVGRVQPHIEVKIVDAAGHVVPRGTPGELLTRGYSVMLGYWNDEERTREAIDTARWMHTGDLATIDAEGYCNIVGRIKDMVIRGGENIYPREIEEFLYRHPKIQDVQVIGVPDPRYGEELCAWIRLRDGERATAEEIRAFCQGQIAHYKIPRYVK